MTNKTESELLAEMCGTLDRIEGAVDTLVDILKDYTGYSYQEELEGEEEEEAT
jgi:hypothetical protein